MIIQNMYSHETITQSEQLHNSTDFSSFLNLRKCSFKVLLHM